MEDGLRIIALDSLVQYRWPDWATFRHTTTTLQGGEGLGPLQLHFIDLASLSVVTNFPVSIDASCKRNSNSQYL